MVGDSPVCDRGKRTIRYLSRARHVKPSSNLRGPSRKAKYSLATDSEPSSASERWEEPLSGEDSEPETTCLQAIRGRLARVESPTGVGRNSKTQIANNKQSPMTKDTNAD